MSGPMRIAEHAIGNGSGRLKKRVFHCELWSKSQLTPDAIAGGAIIALIRLLICNGNGGVRIVLPNQVCQLRFLTVLTDDVEDLAAHLRFGCTEAIGNGTSGVPYMQEWPPRGRCEDPNRFAENGRSCHFTDEQIKAH